MKVGIKYKESFPQMLIALFLCVKRALGGPKLLLYRNLVDNASKLSSYGLDRCRNRSIMRQGEKYNLRFQQIHIDPEMLLSWIMFKYISVADSENYSGYWGIQICELSGFLTDSFLLFSSRLNK